MHIIVDGGIRALQYTRKDKVMTIWPTADDIAMLLFYLLTAIYILGTAILILAFKKK